MSFYNIAVSVFLAYSPIGSLALHNTVLLPGLGNFFQVPSEKSQLIEPTKKLEPVQQLKPNQTNSPQFQTIEPDSQKLTQCLRRLRDSRTRQSSSVSGSVVSSNNLGGSNAIVGLVLGTGTAIVTDRPGNRSTVATAPTPPKINTSGNGRAACQEGGCRSKYPESARREGIEGTLLRVDVDAQGNVTNVRLIRSSGNRDLDEETLRQARNWKFKPASGGRQGVLVATEYAIADSCRQLQSEERRRRGSSQTEN